MLGLSPIPKEFPEGAKPTFTIGVDAGNGEVNKTLEIRFDANGEVQGIHGLVAHVLPIDNCLSEVYLVFNPPVVREKS
ncbi:MAG TPA: hypothetical protein ENF57_00910 [Candidatus Korarchaeota archaeon]|nr:hypothetical protein [Candidatus Korarchaeota archaeon]